MCSIYCSHFTSAFDSPSPAVPLRGPSTSPTRGEVKRHFVQRSIHLSPGGRGEKTLCPKIDSPLPWWERSTDREAGRRVRGNQKRIMKCEQYILLALHKHKHPLTPTP